MFPPSQKSTSSPSLKRVSANFKKWRATRVKNARIPEALWQQVILLLSKHRVGEVAQTLHLSGNQIKARTQCAAPQAKPPTFVPVTVPQLSKESEGGKIEIKRADGAILSIDRLNQATLMNVLTQFIGGLSC